MKFRKRYVLSLQIIFPLLIHRSKAITTPERITPSFNQFLFLQDKGKGFLEDPSGWIHMLFRRTGVRERCLNDGVWFVTAGEKMVCVVGWVTKDMRPGPSGTEVARIERKEIIAKLLSLSFFFLPLFLLTLLSGLQFFFFQLCYPAAIPRPQADGWLDGWKKRSWNKRLIGHQM